MANSTDFNVLLINCLVKHPEGTLRFYRNGEVDGSNQSWSHGIVQVYLLSQWGNICNDPSVGSDEADVMCHQLGYSGASHYSNTAVMSM